MALPRGGAAKVKSWSINCPQDMIKIVKSESGLSTSRCTVAVTKRALGKGDPSTTESR